MFTHFLLSVGADMHIPDLTHVKYNIQKHINVLRYCHYKRISLQVTHNPDYEPSRMGLWWDDGRAGDRYQVGVYGFWKSGQTSGGTTDATLYASGQKE